ncbi:MAG: chaperone modulator CbpM [Pseudomonadota bacterium]
MAKGTTKDISFLAVTGMVLDDETQLSFYELCSICDISAETIMDMVEEGLIEPDGREPMEWRFRSYEIRRVQVAMRLQQDLRVNLPGAAVIVDLLEELEELRRRK